MHLCTPCVNIGAEIHSSDRIIPLILLALAARQPAESGADVGEGAEPEVLDRFAPHEPGIATACGIYILVKVISGLRPRWRPQLLALCKGFNL